MDGFLVWIGSGWRRDVGMVGLGWVGGSGGFQMWYFRVGGDGVLLVCMLRTHRRVLEADKSVSH